MAEGVASRYFAVRVIAVSMAANGFGSNKLSRAFPTAGKGPTLHLLGR